MKAKFILNFKPDMVDKPLTYLLIKEYDIKINILRGIITPGKEGRLLIEMIADDDAIEKGLEFLRNENVEVIPLQKKISLREDECVHCGACISVCPSGALEMNRENWMLVFTPEQCVACGLCKSACPLRLFKLDFAE